MMRLDGQVIIIAGAMGGLGQTVTPAFVDAGASVVMVDRHIPEEVRENRLAMTADVTDENSVRLAVVEVMQKVGRVDGLVNLVGGFGLGRVADTDASLWQKMLAMNLTAAFLLSRAVLPHMVGRGSGRIVHVAARAALDPFPGAVAYIVSKSGLVALVKTLALELAGTGVTVNAVLPTTIDTPANRAGMPEADHLKWVQPSAIAELLLFLSGEEAGAINGALVPIGAP